MRLTDIGIILSTCLYPGRMKFLGKALAFRRLYLSAARVVSP
jgi:hypothetical protein